MLRNRLPLISKESKLSLGISYPFPWQGSHQGGEEDGCNYSFPQAPKSPGTGHVRVGGASASELEDSGRVPLNWT